MGGGCILFQFVVSVAAIAAIVCYDFLETVPTEDGFGLVGRKSIEEKEQAVGNRSTGLSQVKMEGSTRD